MGEQSLGYCRACRCHFYTFLGYVAHSWENPLHVLVSAQPLSTESSPQTDVAQLKGMLKQDLVTVLKPFAEAAVLWQGIENNTIFSCDMPISPNDLHRAAEFYSQLEAFND